MENALEIIVSVAVFVFSVVVHENAHGVAAERFGDSTARDSGRITMNPLPHIDPIGSVILPVLAIINTLPPFGWAKPVPVDSSNLRNPFVHNAYVAAAGPASNFILAILSAVLYTIVLLFYKHVPLLQVNGEGSLLFFRTLFGNMIQINCILGIFNLIPVPPLDGHWILFRYLPPRAGAALAAIRPYGFMILIIMVWTPVLGYIIMPPFQFIAGGLFRLVNFAVATF